MSAMIVVALFIIAHMLKRRNLGSNHQKYGRLERAEIKTEENGLVNGNNDGEGHLLDTTETELCMIICGQLELYCNDPKAE